MGSMKLTNKNINEYFTIETKLNDVLLPNVLIRPKGFPPINTKISTQEFNSTFYLQGIKDGEFVFDYNKKVKLWIMTNVHENNPFNEGEIFMYSPDNNPKSINTGIKVEVLEKFI